MKHEVHYSSNTVEWYTPHDLYAQLDSEFNFTLDPCATNENHKCSKWYTKQENGLMQQWDGERVFMNPPYGREIGQWVKKASEARGGVVVCLLPARTDTKYFHEYIYNKAEIRFIRGRLKFGGSKTSAPFPSMIVVFKN